MFSAISVGTYIISVIIAAILGGVASVFVYRNNTKSIDKVADKIDNVHDVLKE